MTHFMLLRDMLFLRFGRCYDAGAWDLLCEMILTAAK